MTQITDLDLLAVADDNDLYFIWDDSAKRLKAISHANLSASIGGGGLPGDYLLLTYSGNNFSATNDQTVSWNGVQESTGIFANWSADSKIEIPEDGRYIMTLSCGAVGPNVELWVEKNNALVTGFPSASIDGVGGSSGRGNVITSAPMLLTAGDVLEGHYRYTGSGAGNFGGTATNWVSVYRISA